MKTIKQPDTATITIDKATHEIIKNLARLDDRSVKAWLKREFLGMNPIRNPTESTQKPTESTQKPTESTQKPTEHNQQDTNKLLEAMYKDDVNLLENNLKDTLEGDDVLGDWD